MGLGLQMAKTTTPSHGLINRIHLNPLHLVEPQPARSGSELVVTVFRFGFLKRIHRVEA